MTFLSFFVHKMRANGKETADTLEKFLRDSSDDLTVVLFHLYKKISEPFIDKSFPIM